jgi:hypothetical protein
MRRIAVVAVLAAFAACRRETARPPAAPPATRTAPPAVSRQPSAPEPPKVSLKSTPQKCAGDGSYAAAVDCIRMAASLRFHSSEGDGEMTRRTSGAERLRVHEYDGDWMAEAQRSGIVWTHDGKRMTDVPQKLAKLWERLTIFPDPQKKEGAPMLSMEGNVRRYDFTDANTGDRYRVWVAPDDGHITKLQVNAWSISFG